MHRFFLLVPVRICGCRVPDPAAARSSRPCPLCRQAHKSARSSMPDAERLNKVRKTMARIKFVLTERAHEYQDPQLRAALKRIVNAV